ncbi:MAG: transglycosylase SLT domain-containing protein [Acidobacteriia bacterium]|nr:transglycosylase SLT domain-containing protein [Terriglobia bacterium]
MWCARARAATASLLILSLSFGAAPGAFAQAPAKKKPRPRAASCRAGCTPQTLAPEIAAAAPEDQAAQRELADLARALHNDVPGAYAKLAAFSAKHSASIWGPRAALALGYADESKNRHKEALQWLGKARRDTLLGDYALYWSAQANRALNHPAQELDNLHALQRDYPRTAMREQVLEALAASALDLGQPQEALAALENYPPATAKPELLLLLARARQAARQTARAAADYQTIYYRYPLSDEAKTAGSALSALQRSLRNEYPRPALELQVKRAQAFYDAKKWRETRAEFEKVLAQAPREAADPLRQRAQLRIAQARVQSNASPALVASLSLSDAETDAERLYALSQIWRTRKDEAEMFRAIRQLLEKYPQSRWAEEALMAEGNYYWVQLDRARAAEDYKRIAEAYPGGKNAQIAEWRIVWVAYLNRQSDADDRLQAFLLKYPASPYTVNALYWLGRSAERNGNPAHARTFFDKAVSRFPQSYFGMAAAQRLAVIGPGEENPAEFLDKIPPAPPLHPLDEPIPAAAAERWTRAQALRSIAFDASAEQELKFAYFATAAPRLLLQAAQAAFDQGHFAAGMAYGRLVMPNLEARRKDDAPLAAWKALYPLPYEAALRREAAKNGLDPALVAGLIRQESTFQADAVSHANAIGLMQMLPKTGQQVAKKLHLRYSKKKLFDPEFNLTVGTVYLAGLLRDTGGPEQALAAFNAGEDRIASWSAERKYGEIAELVESIPFTETREYVQIVLRNAELYRMIYGAAGTQTAAWHLPVRQ